MQALPVATHFRWTFNNSFEASEVQTGKFSYNGTHSSLNYRAESNQVPIQPKVTNIYKKYLLYVNYGLN
jgi:hypothetical protein